MSVSLKSLCSNILPAGTYKVIVEDIKYKNVEGVTTSDLQVYYRVTEGSKKGSSLVETIGEQTFNFKLAPFAKATGLDMNREFPTTKELLDYVIKSAKSAVLMVEVIIKTFNENDYNNIKSYIALPGSSTTAEDVLADFNIEPIKGEKPHLDDLPFPETNAQPSVEPKIDTEDLF